MDSSRVSGAVWRGYGPRGEGCRSATGSGRPRGTPGRLEVPRRAARRSRWACAAPPRDGRCGARPRVTAIPTRMARCPGRGAGRGATARPNRSPGERAARGQRGSEPAFPAAWWPRRPSVPRSFRRSGLQLSAPRARREDLGSPVPPRCSSRRRGAGDEASQSDPRQGVLPPQARSCCALRLRVSDRRTGVGQSCPTQFPLADTDIGVCRTVGHDSLLVVFHENASDRPTWHKSPWLWQISVRPSRPTASDGVRRRCAPPPLRPLTARPGAGALGRRTRPVPP